MLRVFTQEEFVALPIDSEGYKICPSGDYSQINEFGAKNKFGARSKFGDESEFGAWNVFGRENKFGAWNKFGACNEFGGRNEFGERNMFGEGGIFGRWSTFGRWSIFGVYNLFDEGCTFCPNTVIEGRYVMDAPYIFTVCGCGDDRVKTQFYRLRDDNILVRNDSFLGKESEFIAEAQKDENKNYTKQMISALELAKMTI